MFDLFSKVKRAEELIENFSQSEVLPLKEMEELIGHGRKDQKVAVLVGERLRELAYESPLVWRGWLAIVSGELGKEGVLACLETLGRDKGVAEEEGADHDETFIDDVMMPGLLRGIGLVLNEAFVWAHQAEFASVRNRVYEALDGVVIGGDVKAKARLRVFVQERWEIERVDVEGRENAITILIMLHHLGVDVGPRIEEARGWTRGDSFLAGEENDLELIVSGKLDALEEAQRLSSLTWKENAKRIGSSIGAA